MALTVSDVDRFEAARPRLEAIAYRLLGSASEAEDAVQETFLRWQAADIGRIEVPEAWLTKVLTNWCLNLLASVRVRRETYVGRWLPEPLLAGDPMLGPADTALQLTDRGQIVVDSTMRSVSHPDVYAVGDAAMARGPLDKPLRMSCASGVPMAWQAADAIAARLADTKVPRVSIRYFQQCISLGRNEGLIQFVTADDRAVDRALTGRMAARYKELVCKGAAWGVGRPTLGMPTRRRRVVRQETPSRARAQAQA